MVSLSPSATSSDSVSLFADPSLEVLVYLSLPTISLPPTFSRVNTPNIGTLFRPTRSLPPSSFDLIIRSDLTSSPSSPNSSVNDSLMASRSSLRLHRKASPIPRKLCQTSFKRFRTEKSHRSTFPSRIKFIASGTIAAVNQSLSRSSVDVELGRNLNTTINL